MEPKQATKKICRVVLPAVHARCVFDPTNTIILGFATKKTRCYRFIIIAAIFVHFVQILKAKRARLGQINANEF